MSEGKVKTLEVYAIKDTKVGFWKPFIQPNEAVAVRDFANMVNNSDDRFVRDCYSDLELYRLGYFDDITGVITSDVKFVVSGISLKRRSDSDGTNSI